MIRRVAWAIMAAALAVITWTAIKGLTIYAHPHPDPHRPNWSWLFYQIFVLIPEFFVVIPWGGAWLLAEARYSGSGRLWWRWWGGAALMVPEVFVLRVLDENITGYGFAAFGSPFNIGWLALAFLPLWAIWYLVRDRHRRRAALAPA